MIDANGNGVLSLAEFDRGLLEVLGGDYTQRVFRAKPAIIRAFQAAKAANRGGEIPTSRGQLGVLAGDDYVDYSEFRLLLAYLRQYFELYLMFQAIDGGELGDRSISEVEFRRAVPMVEAWGSTDGRPPLKIADPRAVFAAIDANGSGSIRFDEFAQWALDQRLDLEDDDNVEDVELPLPAAALADADAIGKQARRAHAALSRSMLRRKPSSGTVAAAKVRGVSDYGSLGRMKAGLVQPWSKVPVNSYLASDRVVSREQARRRVIGAYETCYKRQVLGSLAGTMAHLDADVYEYKRALEERPPLPPKPPPPRRSLGGSASASALARPPRGGSSAALSSTYSAADLGSSSAIDVGSAAPLGSSPMPHVLGAPPAYSSTLDSSVFGAHASLGWEESLSKSLPSPAGLTGSQPWDGGRSLAAELSGMAASHFAAKTAATAAAEAAAVASGLRRKPWDSRAVSAGTGLTAGIPAYDRQAPISNRDVERLIRQKERAAMTRLWPSARLKPVPASGLLPLGAERSLSTLTLSLETSPSPSAFGRASSPSLISSPRKVTSPGRKYRSKALQLHAFAVRAPESVPGSRREVRWCTPDTRYDDPERPDDARMTWTGTGGAETTSERVRKGRGAK